MLKRALPFVMVAAAIAFVACSLNGHLTGGTSPSNPYVDTSYSESVACTAGACAGSAPTAYSDGGMSAGASLVNVDSFRLEMCAWGAQQFQDAGSLQAYVCDFNSTSCYRDPPLDQLVVVTGQNCMAFPDFQVGLITKNLDKVEFVPTGVVVNGLDGGPMTVRVYTHQERFRQ